MSRHPLWLAAAATLALAASPARASTFTTIFTFGPAGTPCCGPAHGALARDAAGNLYGGMTLSGGPIYELSPPATSAGAWTGTTLFNFFNATDGGGDHGTLLVLKNGTLLGTSTGVGSRLGNVFQLAPPAPPSGTWQYTTLHDFAGHLSNDGATPLGGLLALQGVYYGTTTQGSVGPTNGGTIYSLTPPKTRRGSWTEKVIYSFPAFHRTGIPGVEFWDGDAPTAGLIADSAGALYGTTPDGGAGSGTTEAIDNDGTVFKLAPPATAGGAWGETVLHSFIGGAKDGSTPYAPVVMDAAGALYGTAEFGGTCTLLVGGCGVVFKLTPNGNGTYTETLLHVFAGTDGAVPVGGLTRGKGGRLYGTTMWGGPASNTACGSEGCGMIYVLTPVGSTGSYKFSALHNFNGGSDGCGPLAPMIADGTGLLYGTTSDCGDGTAFTFMP